MADTYRLSAYPQLASAISVHGALLPCEMNTLELDAQALCEAKLLMKVDTPVGPLYYPRQLARRRPLEDGNTMKGRTPSALIDGAYVRLFILKSMQAGQQWTVLNPHNLGRLSQHYEKMPSSVIAGKETYVVGKVLGGGVTTKLIKSFVAVHRFPLERAGKGIQFLVPNMRRYRQIARAVPSLVSFELYTPEQAQADNASLSRSKIL